MYKDLLLDNHLSSLIDNRKDPILGADFIIMKDGKEIDEFKDMFRTKWFTDFVNLALDSLYYGFSVIEFGNLVNGEFSEINLTPREYCKPEFGIVGETMASLTGVSWDDDPYKKWTLFIGDRTNLGLLAKAGPHVIWKKNAIMSYAEFVSLMGVPLRVLKTDVYDKDTRDAGENMMRNMGTSAYAVISKEDEIELKDSMQARGADALFNGLVTTCNEEMSKLILGGTALMEANAFVGSSQIHQDSFLTIVEKDKVFIRNILNYKLVPFLIQHGFKLEDCKIEVEKNEELTLKERFAMDAQLLQYYNIPANYFNKTYGTEVVDKPVTAAPTQNMDAQADAKALSTPDKMPEIKPDTDFKTGDFNKKQ